MCVGCLAALSLAWIQVGLQKFGIPGTSQIDDRLVNTLEISLLSIKLHREFNGRCGESFIDRIHIGKSASRLEHRDPYLGEIAVAIERVSLLILPAFLQPLP